MSEPEFDSDKPDTESMFDFLAEEGTTRRAPRKPLKEEAERALPIIRKPVPVSESGPLLPPKPGAPVEPPPQLTANKATSFEDDLDFLEDVQNDATVLKPTTAKPSSTPAPDNVTPLRRPADSEPARSDDLDLGLDDLGLDLDDRVSFDSDWRDGHGSTSALVDRATETPGRFRGIAFLVAALLIGVGLISFFYTDLIKWTGREAAEVGSAGNVEVISTAPEPLPNGSDESVAPPGAIDAEPEQNSDPLATNLGSIEPSPLMSRFRARLAELEALVLAGSLDDAEQLLTTMDRTVYGYGAFEFGEMESRISRIRSGEAVDQVMVNAPQNTNNDQTALTDESAAIEQEPLAAQAAEAAQAEAARLEQERLAAEAAQAEAARLEQERLAAEAAQAEAARLERERQAADADRRATDRRIAEERAAAQRQQARELRLQQAREREAARAQAEQLAAQQAREAQREQDRLQVQRAEALAAEQRAERQQLQSQAPQSGSSTAASEDENTVAAVDRFISDDDLQLVYRRFTELQKAVRDRDINAVVSLTQRSGIRVQQFMQMFENSVEIDARIRNVSTRNATGEINGTLQIRKIRRADGSVTEAPANLASVQLSSKREPNGWSAIRW